MTHTPDLIAELNNAPLSKQPYASYYGLRKSMGLLAYWIDCYTPLYKYTSFSFIRDYLPILSFFVSLLYQADEELEAAQKGHIPFMDDLPWTRRWGVVRSVLKELGLYSPLIEAEAENLAVYWQLENRMMYRGELSHAIIIQALDLRTSDIFLIHHICHQIAGIPYDPDHFAALTALETTIELIVDLSEYEDDVANQDYNTYRMFVKLYGAQGKDAVEVEWNRRRSIFQERVARLPEDQQLVFKEIDALYRQLLPFRIPDPILEP